MFTVVAILASLTLLNAYPTEYNPVELSFKKLESGESSGEIVNQCCQRESKFVTVGYGISEGEVRIDVGQCRQKCLVPMVKPLKREEFDRYLKKYPDMDPIQIFLSLQTKNAKSSHQISSSSVEIIDAIDPSSGHLTYSGLPVTNTNGHLSTSCIQSTCMPKMTKRETYYDISGEKELDIIESCDCLSLPQRGCQRVSSMIKINGDTPYEREVDLGQCLGSCDDDSAEHCLSCRPIRNRTVSFDGPNGSHCLDVIDDCQCVGECYRIRKFLKVYDYTRVFEAETANAAAVSLNSSSIETLLGNENNNNSIPESVSRSRSIDSIPEIIVSLTKDESSSMEPFTKVIDIGRCSGSCSDAPVASKCLLWSSSHNGTCLSYLSGKRSCTPTKFVSHSYTNKFGKKHTVVSITGCGCR